ncbi:hypothetical protein Q8A73_011161 [Channa argus]|nr:hypothetical protein Q8A73_011161 [Channa argus]
MAVLGNPDMLTRKIKLCHINAHITCRLCEGYLIDATTVTECLHTFCRSCLVKYLEENNTCPTCRIVIHQSHPLQYIGHDRTMQDIVYKLVPGLQEAEIKKQREFYQKLGMEVPGDIKGELCNMKTHLDQRNGDAKSEDTPNKEAGEEKPEEDNDYHRSDEQVSICLECNSSKLRGLKRKWIRCSAQATVLHLKKFIAKKLNLTSFNELDILCNEEILGKDHTLKFVVVTRWRFKELTATLQPALQHVTFNTKGCSVNKASNCDLSIVPRTSSPVRPMNLNEGFAPASSRSCSVRDRHKSTVLQSSAVAFLLYLYVLESLDVFSCQSCLAVGKIGLGISSETSPARSEAANCRRFSSCACLLCFGLATPVGSFVISRQGPCRAQSCRYTELRACGEPAVDILVFSSVLGPLDECQEVGGGVSFLKKGDSHGWNDSESGPVLHGILSAAGFDSSLPVLLHSRLD